MSALDKVIEKYTGVHRHSIIEMMCKIYMI